MNQTTGKRIAILALHLESNRFAPPVGRADFEEKVLLYGDAIMADAASDHPRLGGTITGFIDAMNETGPWTPVPIVVADGGAAGPVTQDFYRALEDDMRRRLQAAMPLDGVYFGQHGAAVSTGSPDPDGATEGGRAARHPRLFRSPLRRATVGAPLTLSSFQYIRRAGTGESCTPPALSPRKVTDRRRVFRMGAS